MTTIDNNQSVRQGVDLDKLEQFVEFASANPADVQFRLEATGEYEGRAAHTATSTGPYTLGGQRIDRLARRYTRHYGAHREVEEALGFTDPTDREEVIEAVLAALTGCINTAVSSSALVRGIELEELVTKVSVAWIRSCSCTSPTRSGTACPPRSSATCGSSCTCPPPG